MYYFVAVIVTVGAGMAGLDGIEAPGNTVTVATTGLFPQ
jgi:hypothetical protein